MWINRRHEEARCDRPGPLPLSLQARIRRLAEIESHARFLDRMNSHGGIVSSREIPEAEGPDPDDDRPA